MLKAWALLWIPRTFHVTNFKLSAGLQVMGVALIVGGGKCLVAVARSDGRNVGWSRMNWRAACGETDEIRSVLNGSIKGSTSRV